MKTRFTFLILLLPLCLMAQAPPVLRQALTTNTAPVNPTNPGQIPVWTGTSWIFTTNLPGIIATGLVSGDLLWTNDTPYLRPVTNERVAISNLYVMSFGFKNEAIQPVDGGEALQFGPRSLDWPNGVWLGNGRHELVFTNVDASRSIIVPVDEGFVDDMVYEIGTATARFRHIYTPNVLAGNSPLTLDSDQEVFLSVLGSGVFNAQSTEVLSLQHFTASAGILNSAGYEHPVGAFTGALFVSSNANGVAYWTTNVNNIGVTNLSVYNNVIFNGGSVSNFNRDILWTNDGVVTKGSVIGLAPKEALRFGGLSSSGNGFNLNIPIADYQQATNVGQGSVAFGSNQLVAGRASGVLSGQWNEIATNATLNVIAGGGTNVMRTNSTTSFIGAGNKNIIGAAVISSAIVSGDRNQNTGSFSFLGAGTDQVLGVGSGFIGGGLGNRVSDSADYSSIVGGRNSVIQTSLNSFIGGGEGNTVVIGTGGAIGGGTGNAIGGVGSTSPHHNTIGGGVSNRVATSASSTTSNSFIGGGLLNNIGSDNSHYSVVAGGQLNGNDSAPHSSIGGGFGNVLGANGRGTTISGGVFNNISSSTNGAIGGGFSNIVSGADLAIVPGGRLNIFGTSGDYGVSLGHSNNINAFAAMVVGVRGTNAVANAVDIAPDGDVTKTTFHSASNFFRGPVKIGQGGGLITNVLTASAALTFTAVAAQTSQDQSITVTGTTTNDVVTLGTPFHVQGAGAINCDFTAFTSNDTVWVRMNNYSSATRSTNGVFKVMVTRF